MGVTGAAHHSSPIAVSMSPLSGSLDKLPAAEIQAFFPRGNAHEQT